MFPVLGEKNPLTTFKVRKLLAKALTCMCLEPGDFGFHYFQCSGACMDLEMQVPFKKLKMHGHWRSDAVWNILSGVPLGRSFW